ncbi:ribonuclease J [Halieaceae bacterium IMCC14734]|uniref:Ribonuclease J n=1 Tax=Candidatus Litorirhabdus singularis TaxID=2518993 RepID=A0ABT3TES5_9GAMM|nr:ribonuclease J [Candidatus Litorirhabdus singularis]MCX2980812.1 ribonuclease J [Candidatus Litorirhabdus singularis]
MTPTEKDLWFLPLGGCGEIGMNLSLYGHNGQWLMVDCGIGFDREAVGTRIIAPSIEFVAARRQQLIGMVITHAHEDHVGAVAHLWPELRCPVYCTRFTSEILRRKLSEAGLEKDVQVHIVEPRLRHQLGHFDLEWFGLTHSAPESQALMIRTRCGNVFHTGDWKIDPDPVVGSSIDSAALKRLGDEGVLAMVCDSTNAMLTGHSLSEGDLYKGLLEHARHAKGRIIVACFGSNVARLHTLAKVAQETGRYPALLGRSLHNYYGAARRSQLWTLDQGFIESQHLGYLPRQDVFAVATGSQGESGAALGRLAAGNHPAMELEMGDTVIFSSRVIPGNEESLERLCDSLRARGVDVIQDEHSLPIHASGHPAQDELRIMYEWIRPQLSIPVHGEAQHLRAHAGFAKSIGVPSQVRGMNGDLITLAPQISARRGAAEFGRVEIKR